VTDSRHRFLFSKGNIRGIWVNLEAGYQQLLSNSDYPEMLQTTLGEACVASCLLAATIKSNGSLTMQLKGDGDLQMLVMQTLADGDFRGMASWAENRKLSSASLFGKQGKLVITLDPGEGKKRYQGITEVVDDSLLLSLENYLTRSEQLPTRLWLASRPGEKTAGLLLQQLPDADLEYWEHLTIMADTIKSDELLDLDVQDILTRLYHEESLQLFPEEKLRFSCSCTRQKVVDMILGLGSVEAQQVLAEESIFEVKCEFCSKKDCFDEIDLETIFTTGKPPNMDDKIH